MRIVFRTDASLTIGTGHVMRCLALANALRDQGTQCSFICRPHDGHLLKLIEQRGHQPIALPVLQERARPSRNATAHAALLATDWLTDAEDTQQVLKSKSDSESTEWLVVDHYALDQQWEQALRSYARRIMVIDDLADRPHDCDLLLDQNLGRQAEHYDGLISSHTEALIGPSYALLRPEFAQWREYSLRRRENPQLKSLLITMGGVDLANATGQVLDALARCELPAEMRITVVMGSTATWLVTVQAQAATMPRPTHVLSDVNNMAQLMAESDLCIGAAGSTSWERCCLGLPTILFSLAANQKDTALAMKSLGAAWVLTELRQLILLLCNLFSSSKQTETLRKVSQTAAQLTYGDGVDKVVQRLKLSY